MKSKWLKACFDYRIIIASIMVVVIGLVILLMNWINSEFYRNLLISTIISIIVIAIVIQYFTIVSEYKIEIARLEEEIEVFRGCSKDDGIKYKIAGNVRLLNRYGKTDINLKKCYIKADSLKKVQLQGANCEYAHFETKNLQKANFDGANLIKASLKGTDLDGATFDGATLIETEMANIKNLHVDNLCKAKKLDNISDLPDEYKKQIRNNKKCLNLVSIESDWLKTNDEEE